MNTHVDKTQENKSQSVAKQISQQQIVGESVFQFVDNRPEAIAQRKLQEIVNNNLQEKQSKDFQEAAIDIVSRQTKGVVPQNSLQRKSTIVQRALSEEIMVELRAWVREQAVLKNIHKNHMDGLMKDAESLKEGYRTTLEQAKERMNSPAGFKKFQDLSDLTRQAENAIRFGGATEKEVEAVLICLGKEKVERFLSAEEKVYIKSLPGGDLMKNCHHYAFGGLKGEDALFSYQALSASLKINTAESGSLIDASQLKGVQNEVTVTVRSYGMPHSSREEDGLVWHKFVGVPCLFAIPTSPDLGNGVVKTFRVNTSSV